MNTGVFMEAISLSKIRVTLSGLLNKPVTTGNEPCDMLNRPFINTYVR